MNALITTRPLTLDEIWERLGSRARTNVAVLMKAMTWIDSHRKIDPAVKKIAGRPESLNLSFWRLRAMFYRWRACGKSWEALVNHRECGGCGLPGCAGKRDVTLPQALVDDWCRRAGENKKDALKRAWKEVITALASGERLPCLCNGAAGTWVELFVERYPSREIPAHCPWSASHPPKGWSLKNFRARPMNEAAFCLVKQGYFDAVQLLPEVRLNVGALRPLELVVFDDCDLDFRVLVQVGDKWQSVRLKGLFCMDVATRMILSFCLRPEMIREDGTKIRWTLKDMHHLSANVLARYGVPTAWKMEMLFENGTATLEREFCELLNRVTGGQVITRSTGMIRGDLMQLGYRENSGNPRGKPWLESFFRLLHRTLGAVQGQTGSNYTLKDGDHDGRLAVAGRLERILNALPPAERQKLLTPFQFASDAGWLVQHAIEELHHRTDHDLTGFEKRSYWRDSIRGEWKPTLLAYAAPDQENDVRWFSSLSEDEKNARFYCDKNRFTMMMESPAQRWERLTHGVNFQRVSEAVFVDLMLDCVEGQYLGGGVIDLKIGRGAGAEKTVRFRGDNHRLAAGDAVLCRLNIDNPEAGVWFQDKQGRYLGTMRLEGFKDDDARLKADLGAYKKAHTEMQAVANKILMNPAKTREQMERLAASGDIIYNLAAETLRAKQTTAPENPESKFLVEQVEKPRRKVTRHREKDLPDTPPVSTREAFSFESEE